MKTACLLTICILGLITAACVATATSSGKPYLTPATELPTLAVTPPTATKRPIPTSTPTMSLPQVPTTTRTNTSTPAPTPIGISTEYVWKCWKPDSYPPCQPIFPLGMKAITFVSESNGWVVGEGGYIAHWDGKNWEQIESSTEANINAVAFITPDNGWAVGDGGQILHWDGNAWVVVRPYQPPSQGQSTISYELNSIAFANVNDGWAVGGISTEMGGVALILRWDGNDWVETYSNYCGCDLTAIEVITPGDVWAVGGGDRGVTIHWNGDQWEWVANPVQYWLYSVSAVSPEDIWAVGIDPIPNSVFSRGSVIHWNGQEWEAIELPSRPFPDQLSSVAAFSMDDVLLAGNIHFHWNGNRWTQIIFDAPLDDQNQIELNNDLIVSIASDPNQQKWAITQDGRLLQLASPASLTETVVPAP